MENELDFIIKNIEVDIDSNSIEFDEWEDADTDEDGYISRHSGAYAYAKGKIKATVTYPPTDQTWITIWESDFKGDPEGYKSTPASWDDPGSVDWDSITWRENNNLEFVDSEGEWPSILEDTDDNENFEAAWSILEDKVQEAVEKKLLEE